MNIRVVKNKVAAPFKSCKVDIIYGKGISKEGELLDLGLECGAIKKRAEVGMKFMEKELDKEEKLRSLSYMTIRKFLINLKNKLLKKIFLKLELVMMKTLSPCQMI